MDNLFSIPLNPGEAEAPELFSEILRGPGGLRLERIVSWGQVTPRGQWYDQEDDEWVVVLEGEARLGFADGRELELKKGESLFLPRRQRHRVLYTSKPCLWLALHGELTPAHKA
jgi:cupin 2 domain-containing protein